jgi:flagellar hook-basal body complex protein FliE
MTVEAIAASSAIESAMQLAPLESATGVVQAEAPNGAFESMVSNLQNLNAEMIDNEKAVSQLALGQTDNLHQVMIASERTRLDFQLLLAVRNKILEAYQELMRMQA